MKPSYLLPEGPHRATPVEAVLGETKDRKPQVGVSFRLRDRPESITWFGSFSNTLGAGKMTPRQRTMETLRHCGWTGSDISDLSSIRESKKIEVTLVVEHDEYPKGSGKWSAKVKWVNVGSGLPKPMNNDAARRFAEAMRADAAKTPEAKKETHPNAPGADDDAPPPDDDDIAF